MAAVLEQTDAAAKNGSRVDEQIAQATSRIRAHDLTFGGLVLVALVLVYATAMILLDKYLGLAAWVRQFALLGFLAALAGAAYFTVLSPLRKKINPLYAAKRVENTIDDAKNSVTGYVDAQQQGTLNATVKAALANRAAKSVAAADVNKAVDHRGLLYLGGTSIALFLTLIVLFFMFRPAQFSSLVGRTFVPFGSGEIVTQTQIDLVKPDPAEATITTGQPITVTAHVRGKIPSADGPERVRLMVRHNPADPNYTELPMVQGDTSRDFELRVPDHLVQNGFWYKVAGGDAVTPEYKVTVRSLPLFTEFQATYEYPVYLRRKTETATDPQLRAPRGTMVTLVGRTNRDVRDGLMVIEPGGTRVTGAPVAGKPDSLQFAFKLADAGNYKLTFNATTGERSADAFQSRILVEADKTPEIAINKPEEEEITAPTNGQVAIDAKVGDDFGIDTITLKMKIVSPVERPLLDRPYLNGKATSFRRAKDNTWPTDVDYKDSVDLAQLKADPTGLPLELKPDTVIEFYLEATDNCTEPKPNVGRSVAKRVRLTPPKVAEQDKQKLNQEKENRKNEEQKHNAQQEQKLNEEKREPKNGGQQNPEPKDKQPEPKNGEGTKEGTPDPMAPQPPKDKGKEGAPKDNPMGGGMSDMGTPMGTPMPKGKDDMPPNPMGGMDPSGTGSPNAPTPEAPPPKTPEDKAVEKKADELNNAIQQENKDGGAGKSNPTPNEQERADPAQQKKQPPAGDMGNATEPKPDPKPTDPMNPMQDQPAPGTGKSEGKLEKPGDPAAPKPNDPKQGDPKTGMDQKSAPSETRDEPAGLAPGTEKEPPKQPQPPPKDPNQKQKQDPNSGSCAKPATQKDDTQQGGAPDSTGKKDPAADAGSRSKSMPEPTRGGDKPNQPKDQPQPAGGTKSEGKQPDAGEAKPKQAPAAGENKPKPAEDMTTGGGMGAPEPKPESDANQPTKPNGTGAADAKPGDPKKPMGTNSQGVDKGIDKPQPQEGAEPNGGGGTDTPKQKELDENKRKELEQAAKDLTSPDKNKQQEARDKLDKAIGADKRKEMEKLANDLNSPDEKTRADAQRKLEELKKQAQQQQGKQNGENSAKPDEKQMKELEQAAKDLTSPDKNKQQEARDKLDKAIGEDKRKELEQLAKDLQSGDKDKQEAAQKKIDEAMKNAKGGNQGDPKNAPKFDEKQMKELEQAAKDLTSPDENKRKDAREKLDKAIGEDKRKEMEQLAKDLQSDNKDTREAAQKKIDEAMKQAQKQQGKQNGENGAKPNEQQMKEIADAMKDLQSGDDQKKQAAQQKLDKMVGEKNRKDAEQLMKDLQSDNKETREAAQKKLDDLKKELEKQQAQKNGKDGKGKEPSKEELADLMKKAQDLQSKDDKTREKAEKDLDDKIGKENREKLQKELEGKKPGGDPQQDQKLKEQLEQMAKEQSKGQYDPTQNAPGSGTPPKGAMEEDARNRLKTAELRLEDFEKKRYDEAFQKKQGFTDAEYNKFLKDYEDHVEKLRKDVNKLAAGDKPPPAGPTEPGGPILGGAGGKVAPAAKLNSSGVGGGTTVAPPGFEDSKNKFQKLINEKK